MAKDALVPVLLHLYGLPDTGIRRIIILRCFQVLILLIIGIDFRLIRGARGEYLFLGNGLLGVHIALLVGLGFESKGQCYLLFGAGFIVGWHG